MEVAAYMKKRKVKKDLIARSLYLVDDKNKASVMIGAHKDVAFFNLCDSSARPRLSLTVDPAGPHITLFDRKGRAKFSIGVSEEIGSGLQICDPKGRPVCFILVPPDGKPRINLYKAKGNQASKVWMSPR